MPVGSRSTCIATSPLWSAVPLWLAGAAVSLDQIAGWRENLTVNLGWIALAFVIFGGWNPWRVALACFVYPGLLFAVGEFQVEFPSSFRSSRNCHSS